MILLAVSLAFFAALASAHAATEPNMAELKKAVLEYDAKLEKIVEAYQSAGYYTMGNETFYLRLRSMENDIRFFPTDVPLDKLTLNQRMARDAIIGFANGYKYFFSLMTEAGSLSASLKGDALALAVNKTIHHELPVHTLKDISGTVKQAIHQEEGVLVDGRLVKPNPSLEALYAKLHKFDNDDHSGLSGFWRGMPSEVDKIKKYCENSICSTRFRTAIHKYVVADKKVQVGSRIDSQTKVDNLVKTLPELLKAIDDLGHVLIAEKYSCHIFGKDCEKKPEKH